MGDRSMIRGLAFAGRALAAVLCAMALAAHAAWVPYASPGAASLALGAEPGEMSLASQARVLAIGTDDNETVKIVNPDTGAVSGTVALGNKPVSLALNANATRLFVLQDGRKFVYVYDVPSRAQVASWTLNGDLIALALRPGGTELLVADKDGRRIVALNPANGAVLRQKALTSKPASISVNAADTRILIATGDGRLISLNAATLDIVSNAALGDEARSVSFWEGAGLAAVVQKKSDALSLVNIESGAIVARIEMSTDPDRSAIDNAGAKAYVSTRDDLGVSQVDLASRRTDGRFILPARAAAVLFDPVAKMIYVSQAKDKLLLRINPAQHPLLGEVVLNKRLRNIVFNNTTHEAATIADKANELSRVRLADRQVDVLGLSDRPTLVAIDSQLNLAVLAFKKELRFASLSARPPALLAGRLELASKITSLAVDSTRGLTLAVSRKADDEKHEGHKAGGDAAADDDDADSWVHIVGNAARTKLASISSREKLQALAVDARRGLAYFVTDSKKLLTFNIATRAFTRSSSLAFQADAIAVDDELNVAVLTDASKDKAHVIDLATGATTRSFSVPRGPVAVSIQPASHVAVIASKDADQLSLIDLPSGALTPGYASVDSPFAVATSLRFNLALLISGEKDDITIVPLPNAVAQLASIAPSQVTAGIAAFTLTANGANFVDSSRVLFGATPLDTRWISPGKLEATVPAALVGAAGVAAIVVRTPGPGGGDSNAITLAIVSSAPPLAVSALDPASGPVGTSVTLTGTSFDIVAANNHVSFRGAGDVAVPAQVVSASATQLVTVVPAGALTGVVTLTNSRGSATGPVFTVIPGLSIASIAPSSGLVGVAVTLTGTGFDTTPANNQVAFTGAGGSTVAASVSSATATQLVVLVPAGAQSGPIRVTNSRGSAVSPAFTVLAPLAITSIAPASGLAGSQVTITGTGFDPVAANNQVAFTGVGATTAGASIVSASATQLVVVVPSTAASGPITVTNARGSATSTAFTVIPPAPAISAIDPASGPPLTVVTITGTGFIAGAGNTVTFNGSAATVLAATATTLVARVPSGATSGAVSVSTAYGSATGPSFTVQPPLDTDVQLLASPASLDVYQGAAGSVQVQLGSTGILSYTGVATLSASGLPAGVTGTFTPAASVSAFQANTLVLTATDTAAVGDFTLVVTAQTDGGNPITRTARVALRMLPAAGVTGIKGRFVTPAGEGIAGVVARADNGAATQPQTTTDAAGNFQLVGLAAGAYTLRFDATAANPLYPIWPYSITVLSNKIIVIPDWTINPPPADDKFTPIANTAQEQVVVDVRFPGLEIRLPAGTSITGWDGVQKTRIAVERVDMSKLPVTPPPTPTGAGYQLYFGTPMGGIPSQPIPVTLPNDVEAEPGQSVDIWFFDGSPMGGSGEWKVAGQGIVSADGRKISMPNGTGIPRFCGVCGLMCAGKLPPAPNPPPGPPPPCDGNPVDLALGQEMPKSRGMSCGGLTPIDAGMSYNPVDAFNGLGGTSTSIGLGWTLDYDIAFLPFEGPQKRLILPGNNRINFTDVGGGIYRVVDESRFDGATIRATDVAANIWELKFKDGRIWRFRPYPGVNTFIRGGPPTFVNEIVDSQGNVLTVNRQTEGRIVSIGTADRNISMTYGPNGFVSEMRDTAARVTRFTYTATNRLASVTDPDGRATSYTYVNDNEFPAPAACGTLTSMGERLKTITYPGRPNPTTNHYGPGRRVIRQVGYDGREFRFNYRLSGACVTNTATPNVVCTGPTCPSVDSWENFQAGWRIHGGVVVATTVIQPNGQSYSNEFTALGVATARTDTQGQKSSAKFDALNRPIELTDVLGRTNKLAYDANGNVVQSIDALGRVKQFTYHAIWNKPTSVTRFDDSGQALTWSFSYNAATGKLQSATNPLGQTTSFTYTSRGELETVVDALGKVSRYEYNLVGDLTKVLNPLLHETRFGYDGAGRRTTLTEPLGFVTTTTYNGIDGVTRTTDARTKNTDMAYDAAGRLESIKNARGNMIETYAYDAGDRIASRKDALQKSETYQYDASARVISSTDRKGQVTTYEYDSEDRVTATVRPEGRTRFSYDLVGRLTEVSNSAGTISYTYDAADRMVRERVVAGTVTTTMTYQYDALDHRVSRAVAGALSDATTYAYDRAGRMIRISYRGQQTLFEYDAAGRLTKRTLPNGIVMIPKYDDADRVTEIGYFSAGGATIEALQYTYDDNGRRLTETRSASRAPETPFTAAYDNADRMTSITLTAQAKTFNLAYDDNGNLSTKTEQGASNVTSYGWDSLNRLVSITGPGVSASFQYDALGRRISRTVNGESTRYVYDGTQAIAEIRPTGIDTLLTTLGVDEVIARYNSSGARVYLTDALNSVLMQTGADGSTLNTYSYSAFGEVSRSGADEGNDIQYTGRENDGTGLYFYRARFYDPVLKRFISQDPLGPGGGVNFYAYVSGNPLSFSDPYGLYGWGDFVGDAANGAAGFGDALSFGLTGYIRRQWDIDSVDKCSTAYQAGYWGEVGLEVVLTLGSGALRHAAVEVGSRAAQAEARHFTRAYRRDQGLSGGFVHHSNPLVGHPGGGTALFPTGGLPASVHSGAWNLQWTADRAAHNAIHASQQRLEAGAAALVNPVTTGARGGAGAAGNCKCR